MTHIILFTRIALVPAGHKFRVEVFYTSIEDQTGTIDYQLSAYSIRLVSRYSNNIGSSLSAESIYHPMVLVQE